MSRDGVSGLGGVISTFRYLMGYSIYSLCTEPWLPVHFLCFLYFVDFSDFGRYIVLQPNNCVDSIAFKIDFNRYPSFSRF
jgi:hypothetical protein